MYCYLWEYRVREDRLVEFRAAYGPQGGWVALFRRDAAYLGTDLLRDRDDPLRFVTVDRWTDRRSCLAFRERAREAFDALDAAGEEWTESERSLGEFETVAG